MKGRERSLTQILTTKLIKEQSWLKLGFFLIYVHFCLPTQEEFKEEGTGLEGFQLWVLTDVARITGVERELTNKSYTGSWNKETVTRWAK